jgi:phytoene desaturase
MKAIVIGAGFGGISTSLRLKAKSYEVTIIDKIDQLGGRGRVFKMGDYK